MTSNPSFDADTVHKWFSAAWFNRVWELLDQPNRTADEDEAMVSLAHGSLAHWREREDCGPRQLSVGCWQLSRVYAVLGKGEASRHYGKLSLAHADGEPAFYRAYAHEALARAAKIAGDDANFRQHLDQARSLAVEVASAEERQWLDADLTSLTV